MSEEAKPEEPVSAARYVAGRVAMAALVAVAVAAIAIGVSGGREDDEPTRGVEPPRRAQVVYYLEGTVPYVDATIATPTGSSQMSPDLPMHTKDGIPGLAFDFPPGGFAYISAQLQGGYGSVTCRIVIDGTTVSKNTATGTYQIATCQSRVP